MVHRSTDAGQLNLSNYEFTNPEANPMRELNLDRLRTLLAVADLGSFAAAAMRAGWAASSSGRP